MFDRVLAPIKSELQQAQNILAKSHQIRAGHLGRFASLVPGSFHDIIRPALVLLSARIFAPLNSQAVALAAVIQFIYLAARIHRNVRECPGPEDPTDGYQFPVLVGDYFYSRFFTCLCNHGVVKYLKPLSRIICEMSEGGILRIKSGDGQLNADVLKQIVYKETAVLFGGGCRLAGHLAGASEREQKALDRLGTSFGMAVGLSEYAQETNGYLGEALLALTGLPPGESRDILEQLILLFQKQNAGLAVQVG
ncbi:geranylgeranyl pyrophosphate synthase [Desulfofundulus luciae]|uniref:Geranylgeranyl pyrophosphate synthase n=1 Tax=Desulfofundulus luciae TaxID=74702 RepID=A0ABU0AZV1_9FIRM|nr:polyprenyl synthetase family protein [Desulfofundulus luciae]MDQ0285990.1 geranylgeranyl pyrophosphate synthase [Desulfofundulus luciae]